MTSSTQAKLPIHLRRYIVEQDYAIYSPEDQAVWRFIMRQLRGFLSVHAHHSYLDGLTKTGITVDRIPSIHHIDEHLERFGWGAVAVSGFIPPAAFMEFQSLGILPIASDMRTVDHLLYTPAPDIVHEAAGHAPILADPDYAAYLRQYGAVARNAILSKEDLEQYEAIRLLSDIKEDPRSTAAEIAEAERRLNLINSQMSFVSEAALLSRMNWWTAEYGLIGDLSKPRIFGAGLLSSVGEAKMCLSSKVRKIPLSIECVDFTYDITEPQPQLFVTKDFAQLGDVLEALSARLAYRIGGEFGLKRAIEAETVNTVMLDSKIQISGCMKNYLTDERGRPCYLQFDGPSQLAVEDREIPGQGTERHTHGFSCPVGLLKGQPRPLHEFAATELGGLGLKKGYASALEFESGVRVTGKLSNVIYHGGKLILITFVDCRVILGDRVLFDPSWGEYDMAVGSAIPSVAGGPADRENYGKTPDFMARRVPEKDYSTSQMERHSLYAQIRDLRERPRMLERERELFEDLSAAYLKRPSSEWLPGVELLEIAYRFDLNGPARGSLEKRLDPENFKDPSVRMAVEDGLALARQKS
jgi:phenylalanine-4-hydroxylase